MSRLIVSSDWHLGHRNIHKYRTEFSTAQDHHETIFENCATMINKNDSLILLGDIAFDREWLYRLTQINCRKKTLILGNHDTERVHIREICDVFDEVHSLWSKRNCWWSHAPLHPQEMRGRLLNIHGHLHGNQVFVHPQNEKHKKTWQELDQNYFNVCLEHTDYMPVTFQEIVERTNNLNRG